MVKWTTQEKGVHLRDYFKVIWHVGVIKYNSIWGLHSHKVKRRIQRHFANSQERKKCPGFTLYPSLCLLPVSSISQSQPEASWQRNPLQGGSSRKWAKDALQGLPYSNIAIHLLSISAQAQLLGSVHWVSGSYKEKALHAPPTPGTYSNIRRHLHFHNWIKNDVIGS